MDTCILHGIAWPQYFGNMEIVRYDENGIFYTVKEKPSTEGMLSPVECYHCGHVYDSASVKVTHRYVDCSEWECPGCKQIVDDRMWKGPADIIKLD